jgi:hypothetical protein
MRDLKRAFAEAFKEGLALKVFAEAFKEGLALFFSPFTGFWYEAVIDYTHATRYTRASD